MLLSPFSHKNLKTIFGLFFAVFFLLLLIFFQAQQYSTTKLTIIFIILGGYILVIFLKADKLFSQSQVKAYKLSEIHVVQNFENGKKSYHKHSQFENQLRNINAQAQNFQRQSQNASYNRNSYKSFYKTNKIEYFSERQKERTSLKSYSSSFDNEYESIQHFSIIDQIKNRIKPKNSQFSRKRFSNRNTGYQDSKFLKKPTQTTLNVFNSVGVNQDKFQICMQIVQDYLMDSLDPILNSYEFYYKNLSDLISNCFGIRLTLHSQYHKEQRQSISLGEIQILINTIKKQKCLPKVYKCLVKTQELPSYISNIEAVFRKIPNFKQPNSHLALQIYIQILSKDFTQPIKILEDKLSIFIYQNKPNISYFVKNNDGTVGYTKFDSLRSRQPKQVVLLYLINILRTQYKCQKRVIKQLKGYVQLKDEKSASSQKK